MFVGLAPGRLGADRTGIPFSGDRSGFLLRRMIDQAGITSFYITNLVRCNPRDEQGRNRDPSRQEIANCRDYLSQEMELVRPRIVACLGRIAWRELAGPDRLFAPRRPATVRIGELLIYPMYHPAYINRGACSTRVYSGHFRRLRSLLETR
jgi:DNA polymerase